MIASRFRVIWPLSLVLMAACAHRPSPSPAQESSWRALFNGHDLEGWQPWLGVPDKTVEGLEVERDAKGRYRAPLGAADPKQVFSVVLVDGAPALRVSGEIFGALTSDEELDDFHLRVEFKWGERVWPPRADKPRDSGVLYRAIGEHGANDHFRSWKRSLECQIKEGGPGDFWSVVGTTVEVEGFRGEGNQVVWKKGGERFTLPGEPGPMRSPRAVAAQHEKPHGAWNTLEVACVRDTCVHAINGQVVMVLHNPRYPDAGREVPLRRGSIQLQSEGAEVSFRKVEVRGLSSFPAALAP